MCPPFPHMDKILRNGRQDYRYTLGDALTLTILASMMVFIFRISDS
jgi:hypothetical protein